VGIPTVIELTTAREALETLRRSNPHWIEDGMWGSSWIFRGQGHDGRGILPKAWRDKIEDTHVGQFEVCQNEVREATDCRLPASIEKLCEKHPKDRVIALIVQRYFEFCAVHDFVMLADDLGLKVPGGKVPDNWPPIDSVKPDINERRDDPIWQLRALAQHHRVPTRLLDWTTNPLVAAFWACHTTDPTGDGNMAVWALDTNRVLPPLRLLYGERFDFGYLRAQDGLFTYIEDADRGYLDTGTWPELDRWRLPGDALVQVTIPQKQAIDLKRLLWTERISLAHLMPTLDNICVALQFPFEHIAAKRRRPK
jgi:hypothetical protein